MYIEKRKSGKNIKYYLIHSYREKDKVEKIRKYLGSDFNVQPRNLSMKKIENKNLEIVYNDEKNEEDEKESTNPVDE